ncbi:MAG TPA: selenocysteine-specific translation elongation factor, partial [Gemmatimonadales bacterium]|nr:selenocysteine-specific translation elongation factor [Gemmatimonadales bacterium]
MIIGTAGHIDHGKSALVTALTGRPMDRLIEEKRRGITIDLNFAPLRLEGLPPAGIVDVPGHEDFVRTMVAGASGIDLVLLVVDALHGPEPQTWEHLAIVEQLGIPHGIPVLTKKDLAEPEWLELVSGELAERLSRSPVKFEPPVLVSSLTGEGVPELTSRLRAAIARGAAHPRAPVEDGFRMPIDRAFSIAGVGTVVTGTPWSGALRIGDAITVLPSGKSGRVRSLEAYGSAVAEVGPGHRAAVGIAGLERSAIRRGETMVDARLPWRATTALDAEIRLLPGAGPLRRQARVRVHLGTAEVLARAYPRGEIAAGGSGLTRLALESPVLARGADRFVLRSYSPVATIGGGRVLDPLPPRRAPWPETMVAEPGLRAAALVLRREAGIPVEDLPLLLGLPDAECRELVNRSSAISSVGNRLVTSSLVSALKQKTVNIVREFHAANPALPGLSLETLRRSGPGVPAVLEAVLEAQIRAGELISRDGWVALPGFAP